MASGGESMEGPKDDIIKQLNRYCSLWCEITSLYKNWSKKHGLTYNYVLMLYCFLEHKGNCTQKIICEHLDLPKTTVNSILKDYEKQGYVILSTPPTNKRTKLIQLTPTGELYVNNIVSQINELDHSVARKMGLKRMTILNDNLALFVKYFNEDKGNN